MWENFDRGGEYRPNVMTDLARLIRCLLYGKQEQLNSLNVTGLHQLKFCLRTGLRTVMN